MCSDNINNFISLPHSPPKGVPVLWQRWSVYSHVSHFLVSNVPSKFYLLLLVFFSSSFPISNSKTWPFFFFSTVPYHTPQRFILEKKAQNGKIEKTQPTHTHTHTHTAAAERALQFNMFCETLAGAGKMEIEKDGNGETQRKRWDVNWKLNSQFNFTHKRPKCCFPFCCQARRGRRELLAIRNRFIQN